MSEPALPLPNVRSARSERRYFIGGSDARIIMGDDEAALLRLWREKRGEAEPEDLSGNLIVQLGAVTEELNRRWYEANTGQVITDVQTHVRHAGLRWMGATLDGRVEASGAVFEAKSCCRGHSRKKPPPRNIRLNCSTMCGLWRPDRPCCRSLLAGVSGLRSKPMPIRSTSTSSSPPNGNSGAVWRAASPRRLFGVELPKPRVEAVRIVDMSSSNVWAEFAGIFIRTRDAHFEHEKAKAELKGLVPDDAHQAIGHGIRAKRSRAGTITFDLFKPEDRNAAVR